jgi:hypothetical protein
MTQRHSFLYWTDLARQNHSVATPINVYEGGRICVSGIKRFGFQKGLREAVELAPVI